VCLTIPDAHSVKWFHTWQHVVSWRHTNVHCVDSVVCGGGSYGPLIDYPRSGLWKPPLSLPPPPPKTRQLDSCLTRHADAQATTQPLPNTPRFCVVNSTVCWIHTSWWENFLSLLEDQKLCIITQSKVLKTWQADFIVFIFFSFQNKIWLPQL